MEGWGEGVDQEGCTQAKRLSAVLWNKCDPNRKFSGSNGFVHKLLDFDV
jgi:hypothetical protein